MADLVQLGTRSGAIAPAVSVQADQTIVVVSVMPDRAALEQLRAPVALRLVVEQTPDDGLTWFPLTELTIDDVAEHMAGVDKAGTPIDRIWLAVTEQIYRQDLIDRYGFATRRVVETDQRERYHQLQLCPTIRVSIDTFAQDAQRRRSADAELKYAATLETGDTAPPPILLGQHSASLLGIFTGTQNGTSTATTSSRTTTAGSLITVGGASFRATSAHTAYTTSDNKANSFTDVERGAFATNCNCTLGYTLPGGTRGASHTCTATGTGGSGTPGFSVTAQEWDGVASPPTVVSSTATGGTAAVSVSRAVGAASLAVGIVAYAGLSTTITVHTGTTQASEQDESSVQQDQAVAYKVGQTGTPAIEWDLGAARTWGAVIICFTETSGTPATASPAGVSAAWAVGTAVATGDATASPAGVSAAWNVGTAVASGQATASPNGVSAAWQVGTATASAGTDATASPAGVSATWNVGTAAPTGAATASPGGTSGVWAIGTAASTGTATASPSGVSALWQVGTATASGTGDAVATPAGVSAVWDVGDVVAIGGRTAGGGTSVNYQARWPRSATAKPRGVSAGFQVGAAYAIGTSGPLHATARPAGVTATWKAGRSTPRVSVVAHARSGPARRPFTDDEVALLLLLQDDDAA